MPYQEALVGILRVAISGIAGQRGQQLRVLFEQSKKVAVVAGADPLEGSLFESILGSGIDVVVIATPDYCHEEQACAALAAGKHVYLEKPMAVTPQGCERIISASHESGRVLYLGHNLRHFTVIKKLKELIDAGAVGEVKAVWCRHPVSYGRWGYFQQGRWHKKRANSGGLLIHKGSHDLDVIHWLGGGRAKRVVAMGTLAVCGNQPGEPDIEDLSCVLMELDNGVQANYAQCHFARGLACREYMVFGNKGTLRNQDDNPERAAVQLFGKAGFDETATPTEEWSFTSEAGFHGDADKRIVGEFIGILRGTAKPTILPEEAMWAVKAGYAATESLRNGSIPIVIQ